MKINGQEIDMAKVVELYEQENPKPKKGDKCKNMDWWNSQAGMTTREKLSEIMKNNPKIKEIHRMKIKYTAVDNETGEIFELEGQTALAQFLGYSQFNSRLREQYIDTKILSNKTKTKNYYIKETL